MPAAIIRMIGSFLQSVLRLPEAAVPAGIISRVSGFSW